jgi:shikimate kinase
VSAYLLKPARPSRLSPYGTALPAIQGRDEVRPQPLDAFVLFMCIAAAMSEDQGRARSVREISEEARTELLRRLGSRSIVFVGLMGAGKTAIGRKVASELGIGFVDSDQEIEAASRMTVPELFELYGEAEFRALEQRVIARILEGGPQVLSTGGGAYMNAHTREAICGHGVSVWLKADIDVLMERVAKKQNRPLLKTADPRATMERLMAERYPVYASADVTVLTRDERKEVIAAEVVEALGHHLVAVEGAAA